MSIEEIVPIVANDKKVVYRATIEHVDAVEHDDPTSGKQRLSLDSEVEGQNGEKIGEAISRAWFSSRLLSVSASAVHAMYEGMSPSWWVGFDVAWTEGIIATGDQNGTIYICNLSDGLLNKSFVNATFLSNQNNVSKYIFQLR